jgi:alpha-maltose-1-phosphate synthase
MRARVVSSLHEADGLRPAWDALADETGATIAARPFWCLSWWRALGRGRLLVAVAERDGELLALAPLHERSLLGARVVRFLGHGVGVVSELLVRPDEEGAAEAVWRALPASRRGSLQLVGYRDGTAGLPALRRAVRVVRSVRSDRCPVVDLGGGADAVLAARPKRLRATLRRAEARLSEAGWKHEVDLIADPDALEHALGEMRRVHDLADAGRSRQHLLAPPYDSFTVEMLRRAAREGRLRVFLGRVGSTVVSYDAAFVSGRRLEAWLGRVDPAYRDFAPGHLALRAIVRRAASEGLGAVDLGLGDDVYKRQWSKDGYDTLTVQAAASGPALAFGRAAAGAARTAHGVRNALLH